MEKTKNNLQLTIIATIVSLFFLILNKNESYRYVIFLNLLFYLTYYSFNYIKSKNNSNLNPVENKSVLYGLYAINIFSIILVIFYYLLKVNSGNLDNKSTLVTLGLISCIVFSVALAFYILRHLTRNNKKFNFVIPNYILGVILSVIIAIPTLTIFFIITNPLGLE